MVDHVKRIQSAIIDKPPFYASTYTIPTDNPLTKLCYFTKNGVSAVDLLNLSKEDINALSNACKPATFGLNQQDVLDPSYRKALKMDKGNFCTTFELRQDDIGLDILAEIKDNLLDEIIYRDTDAPKFLRAETYKLNVYGKDSFFKKHKDTPRGITMVGSLVISFPTPECEGGGLTLSQDNKSWTWDSAKILKESPPCSFAYIAFYSDVDHEVSTITEGSRVTITYNLYLGPQFDAASADKRTPAPEEAAFEKALNDALHDSTSLPSGGYIAFGLQYTYPVHPNNIDLEDLMDKLKRRDAMTRRVCARLGLNVRPKAVYTNLEYTEGTANFALDRCFDTEYLSRCLYYQLDGVLHLMNGAKIIKSIKANVELQDDYSASEEEESDSDGEDYKMFLSSLATEDSGLEYDSNSEDDSDYDPMAATPSAYYHPSVIPVLWINKNPTLPRQVSTPYIAYGNQASLEYVYADIYLMAYVKRASKRFGMSVDE